MRAQRPIALHAARHGLLVPATVIAEVGYFLAREVRARVESLSCGPWLWWGLCVRRLDQH
jgi:hypothetical protein